MTEAEEAMSDAAGDTAKTPSEDDPTATPTRADDSTPTPAENPGSAAE